MREPTEHSEERRSEDGFSLIELMVVVLIIAILIAIAIPTFLGARSRSHDRAAESTLRYGLAAAKTSFTDGEKYPASQAAAVTTLAGIETAVTFQAGTSAAPKAIQVVSSSASDIIMSVKSASSKCFYATDSVAYGTAFAIEDGACAAATAPGVVTAGTVPAPGSTAAVSAAGTAPTWASSW